APNVIRDTLKYISLFSPLLLNTFSYTHRKSFYLLAGALVGFGTHLVAEGSSDLIYQSDVSSTLRSIQPTPTAFLLVVTLLGSRLSNSVRLLFYFLMLFSVAIGVLVGARGPLLSLLFAGGGILLFRLIRTFSLELRLVAVNLVLVFSLSLHLIVGQIFYPV